MGAVTTPSARPSSARAAAVSIAFAAIRPDAEVAVPGRTAPHPSLLEATSGIPGASARRSASPGDMTRKRIGGLTRRAARAMTSGSPATARRAIRRRAGTARARATISGPIPAGSPIVTMRVGRRAATSGRPPGSVLQFDVDVLTDALVPAPVGIFHLLVQHDLAKVVLDLFELVLGLRLAGQELENMISGLPFEGNAHFPDTEAGQRLSEVRGEGG